MFVDTLNRIAAKPERLIAGYMSGTSTDGVDVALARISGNGEGAKVNLVGFLTEPYPSQVRQRIFDLYPPSSYSSEQLANLSFELADFYVRALMRLLSELGMTAQDLDLIGHHGVIIYHGGGRHVDIVEASVIAERLGVTVVTDLRVRDCAAGGSGAPLSPYVDWILFNHQERARAIQNIGGIANVCAMPPNATVEDLIGFDTGPGNMIIDGLVTLITDGRQTYDEGARLASEGHIDPLLLKDLMSHPFIRRALPKCAGREEFGLFFARDLLERCRSKGIADADVVRTATAFTAEAIADAYRRFILPSIDVAEVIVGGGGTHNPVLMQDLAARMSRVPVMTHRDFGIDNDAREALSWAVLANESLFGNPANVPQVTGAARRVVLGKLIPA